MTNEDQKNPQDCLLLSSERADLRWISNSGALRKGDECIKPPLDLRDSIPHQTHSLRDSQDIYQIFKILLNY